jgi:hypothetical protein
MQPQFAPSTTRRKPAQDLTDEAQFRARMARYGEGDGGRASRRRPGDRAHSKRGFQLGWKGWLVVDCVVVLLVLVAVAAWPPIQACRHQQNTMGFYAGDSEGKCIRRGVSDRIDLANERLKMLVRGSGH